MMVETVEGKLASSPVTKAASGKGKSMSEQGEERQ